MRVYFFSLCYFRLQIFYFPKTSQCILSKCPEDIRRHLSPEACFTDVWRQAELSGGVFETMFFLPGCQGRFCDYTVKVKVCTTATDTKRYYFHLLVNKSYCIPLSWCSSYRKHWLLLVETTYSLGKLFLYGVLT